MKKIKLKENRVICENPHSPFNYFAWPTVTRLPGGDLATVCSGFRMHHVDPFGKLVICYSRDDGKSWTRPAVLIDTPFDDRDGGIAVFGKGRVIVTTFNNSLAFQHMAVTDYAVPQGLRDAEMRLEYINMLKKESNIEDRYVGSFYAISEDGGYTYGELKKAPVMTPHGPCPLPSGGLLFIASIAPTIEKQSEYTHLYSYRLNDEDEFEQIGFLENKTGHQWAEPYAFAVTDEHIIVHIRDEEDSTLLQTESHDGGRSFGELRKINEFGIPSHIMRHSSGVLICAFGYRRDAMGQHVIFSRDDGKSWSSDYVLTDDSSIWDLGYPSTVELSDGSLLTVYYQYDAEVETARIKQCIWDLPEEFLK